MAKTKRTPSFKFSAKRIIGIVMLILSSLLFVLCIFPSFLSIGKFFQGIFGVMAYPLFLLTALIGLALTLNMNYKFNKKFTAYIMVSIISILCLLHVIFTSNVLLNETTGFTNFGDYIKLCYFQTKGITVGGAVLGAFIYFFRALIGLGATYVVFAVIATVFVGLTIDHIIYNKKQGNKTKLFEKKEPSSTPAFSEGDKVNYSFSREEEAEREEFKKRLEQNQAVEARELTKEMPAPVFETVSEPSENQTPMFSFGETNEVQETSTDKEKARNLLFEKSIKAKDAEEEEKSRPKSAREVLFGDRNAPVIPNVFDRSPDERNDWRKQYASKPLQYKEENETIKREEIPAEANNVESDSEESKSTGFNGYNDLGDGSVKTSWGTYRPTANLGMRREMPVNNLRNNEEPKTEPNEGINLGIKASEEEPRSFGRVDRNITRESREINREDRPLGFGTREETIRPSTPLRDERNRFNQNNTISAINKETKDVSEGSNETDFGSRLSRGERRVRGEDLLADASSLGFGSRNTERPSFTEALRQNNRVNEQTQEQRIKPKVEKISFENQLNREYKAPPTSLLKVIKEEVQDYSAEYKQKSMILEQTLDTFKIPAKVINVVRGPKVTRYELSMPIGIPVSRVLSYEKDMSMNLAAKNGIRIEAPIPGKSAFGVEVANDMTSTVGFRELVESNEFRNFRGTLPVAIGKNISGEIIIKSLPKMVHLLVAGSTGSGKSVFLHSLIMSLMFKHSPDELRFIMIDPKRVEFSRYNRMPHLMLPEVVTDCTKAVNALNWAVKEMERRFELLMQNECQKIDQYNALDKVKKGEEKRLPFLIIVVDELAELMGVAKKDVEGKIQRITQLGRACGIHMVVATQRPSVDVVTGVIKNNMPTRIAFSLSSYVDSKTILDEAGAEKLLGQGDMLFSGQDSNQKIRLQGAFVSDEEIKAVLDYIKENNVSEYDEEVQNSIYAEPEKEESLDDDDDKSGSMEDRMDEYMPQALKLVMKNGKASISMIQRRFCVGYARAARIIDQMETRGFIDAGLGNKPRDVKITVSEYNELFGDFDSDN